MNTRDIPPEEEAKNIARANEWQLSPEGIEAQQDAIEYYQKLASMPKEERQKELTKIKSPQGKRQIILPSQNGLISKFIQELLPILQEQEEIFYRLDERQIVRLEYLPLDKNGESKILGFQPLTASRFVTHIEQNVIPGIFVYNKELKFSEFKPKSITSELAKIILASAQLENNLPIINKIYRVPMPILKKGKLTFPKIGYDLELKSWLPYDAPKIRNDMSLEEAKQIINSIYNEFCFKSEQDKTNAIAGLLTPYLRGLYTRPTIRTPIFFYEANRERAGKDYLAGITGLVFYGENSEETPLCDGKTPHDEEFRKKILSKFRAGQDRIHSSNNRGHLASAQLEAIATNENFTDRLLGQNTTVTYQNTLEISLSANAGITYTPDLSNRCIFIKLFLEVEDPNSRTFKNQNLHGYILENRNQILTALFTLVKTWHEKGMPIGSKPFTSFPEWAKICGGIMEACELGNPCIPNNDLISIGGDTETQNMKGLFELCYEEWQGNWIKKSQIMDALSNREEYQELFSWYDLTSKKDRALFGKTFEKYVGRVFSNIKLLRKENSKSERNTYLFQKSGEIGEKGEHFPPSNNGQEIKLYNIYASQNTPLSPPSPHPVRSKSVKDYLLVALDKQKSGVSVETFVAGMKHLGFSSDEIEQTISKGIEQVDWFESPKGTLRRLG